MSIKFAARLAGSIAFASLLSLLSMGQATPPSKPDSQSQVPAQSPPAKDAPQEKDKNSKATPAGTSNDRLFYALPNFLTLESGQKVPPLTSKQKFGVVARSTFDPVEIPWWGVLSAIGQADNSEPAFGQGWGAYGKRYATTAGDSLVENFLVGAIFPSVLHQDPRFFQLSHGNFPHRAFYAVTRILVTRSDSGHSQFNYSEVFGSATAAAISTFSYHPRSAFISTPTNPHRFIASDRTLGNAADVWATQLTLDTITIAIKEFWPDIHRKISHKPKSAPVGNAAEAH